MSRTGLMRPALAALLVGAVVCAPVSAWAESQGTGEVDATGSSVVLQQDDRATDFVIDEDGVVMQKEKCLNLDNNLPVIFGYRERVPGVGQAFHRLSPSLELIMLTVRSFPDIRIASVNAHNTDYLFFSMYYKNNFTEVFRVYIPTKNMQKNMTALISAMPSVVRSGENKRTIDLRYEGKVTLK